MNAELVRVGKKGQQKKIAIKAGVTTVGRRPDCQLRIPLSVVSRKHCRISNKDNSLTIQDLGSANGTYVNDTQITETEIKAGDRVKIGTIDFIIQVDGQPDESSSSDAADDINNASGTALGSLSDSFAGLEDSFSDLGLGADDSFS